MFDNCKKTNEKLKNHYEQDNEFLAFIVNGSVAIGNARAESDLNFPIDAASVQALAINSQGNLYAGTEGKLLASKDSGTIWEELLSGFVE